MHRVLPRSIRWGLFAVGAVALGGAYAVTGSEGVQLVVMFAIVFGVLPAVHRAFGRPGVLADDLHERSAPFRVLAVSFVFLFAWGAVVLAVPDLGLGPWFWSWIVLWPWLEVYLYVAERSLRRDGPATWKPARPLRDAALTGLATAPLIAGIVLAQGDDLEEALLTGLACGGIVFAIGAVYIWTWRRARRPSA